MATKIELRIGRQRRAFHSFKHSSYWDDRAEPSWILWCDAAWWLHIRSIRQ